jgi:hypothetical protein
MSDLHIITNARPRKGEKIQAQNVFLEILMNRDIREIYPGNPDATIKNNQIAG